MIVRHASGRLIGVVFVLCLLQTSPAFAGLGRPLRSIEEDRAALRAQHSLTAHDAYTEHELTLPNSGTVKEFARPDGTVFAVTWNAPGRPDLRQLLGENFAAMQSDTALRPGRRMRRPLAVNRSDLLVQSGGHPGAFWGVALSPDLEPTGFNRADLK